MRAPQFRRVAYVVALVSCGPAPDTGPSETATSAEVILAAAGRAMGVGPEAGSLQLVADARVQGPVEEFRTLIHSSADGRVRMEQMPFGFLAGIGRHEGWVLDSESGQVEDLGSRVAFLRGHELHMLALLPESRLANARLVGASWFGSSDALAVALDLPTEDSLVMYFGALDTLPVGLRVTGTDPDVIVEWSDWIEQDGVRLFREAVLRQGEEVFTYTFDEVRLGTFPDSVFEAPAMPDATSPSG